MPYVMQSSFFIFIVTGMYLSVVGSCFGSTNIYICAVNGTHTFGYTV